MCPAGSATGTLSAGTSISGISGAVLTIAPGLAAALPASSALYIGSATAAASPVEVQRLATNASLRGSFAAMGLAGVIDLDSVAADASGRWVVPSVSGTATAGTIDGVHPSPAVHQAAVAAGIVPVGSIVS